MSDRIEQLVKDIMNTEGFGDNAKTATAIKVAMRSIQGESERAERQRIANKAKKIGDDLYLRILHS